MRKLTKKRFIGVLMSAGISRNEAYEFCKYVKLFGSYKNLAKVICGYPVEIDGYIIKNYRVDIKKD